MLGIAIGVLHLGYWIAYWGVDMITGGNDSFFDVGVPGRWKGPAPKDGPSASTPGQPSTGPAATAPGVNDQVGGQFTAPGHIGANGDATSQTPGQLNN